MAKYQETKYAGSDHYSDSAYLDQLYASPDAYLDPDTLAAPPTGDKVDYDEMIREIDTVNEMLRKRGIGNTQGGHGDPDPYKKMEELTQANNFGYFKTPTALKIAAKIPGPVGTAAKIASVMVGHNNGMAVNAARKSMGLESLPMMEAMKQAKTGTVANVKTPQGEYTVGLEAIGPQGQTTMTPDEARRRGMVRELNPAEVKQRTADLKARKDLQAPDGLFSKPLNAIGEKIQSAINPKSQFPDQPAAPVTPTKEVVGPTSQEEFKDVYRTDPAEGRALGGSLAGRMGGLAPSEPTSVNYGGAAPVGPVATAPSPTARSAVREAVVKDEQYDPVKDVMDTVFGEEEDSIDHGTEVEAAPQSGLRSPTPGGGLANIAPEGWDPAAALETKIGYDDPNKAATRGSISTHLSGENLEAANALANQVGGFSASSAYRSPDVNRAVGGAKNSQHMHGNAIDISQKEFNRIAPTDEAKAEFVERARMSGYETFGTYTNGSIHMDTKTRNNPKNAYNSPIEGVYGYHNYQQANLPNAPDWLTKGLAQTTVAPVPGTKPENVPTGYGFIDDMFADPEITDTQLSQPPSMSLDTSPVDNAYGIPDTDVSTIPAGPMSPASFTAMGQGAQYSPEQLTSMARTLAGELSPDTLKGIAAGEETALQEAMDALGTMDNRSMSNRNISAYDPVDASLTAYDATREDKQKVTDANYGAYKDQLDAVTKAYASGGFAPSNPNATHYTRTDPAYNRAGEMVYGGVQNVGWAQTDAFKNTRVDTGAHSFGTPDQTFKAGTGFGSSYGPTSSPTSSYTAPAKETGNALSGAANMGGGFVSNVSLGMADPTSEVKAFSSSGANTRMNEVANVGLADAVNKTADKGTPAATTADSKTSSKDDTSTSSSSSSSSGDDSGKYSDSKSGLAGGMNGSSNKSGGDKSQSDKAKESGSKGLY